MAIVDFLDLLVREATAAEFEVPLDQARAAGASPERLAELDRAKLLALRVRAMLERHRRREEELSGLFDTASDLAGLRDLDAVLVAIVRRARTLLNADVAYMTLNDDERGDTYMRVTDGSVSARFQALRLPLGAGLGGLVAQTGSPYVTANYPEDSRFRHTREIDGGVTEEGLVAILGVPLRLGPHIIGVLFASNRSARPFAREEVSLLSSLAAHAAVAIDSARLLAGTRTALDELSAAHTAIRAHSDSVERAAAAHDRMTALVLRGAGVQDVAAVVTGVLGGALRVLDADGRELATVGRLDQTELAALPAAVAAARAEGRSVRNGPLWAAAVVAGAEHLGALVLRTDHHLEDADQRILERAAVVTALLLLFRRTVAEAEGRVRGELLDDLVARPVRDVEAVRTRAKRLGVDLDAAHTVVVAGDLGPGAGARALSWAQSYASSRSGLAAARDGRIVLLLPGGGPGPGGVSGSGGSGVSGGFSGAAGAGGGFGSGGSGSAGSQAGDLARAVSRDLGRMLGRPVTAGAGGPVSDPARVAIAYRDADRCLTALSALGRSGAGASTVELGFVGLLLGSGPDGRDGEVESFLSSAVGPVVDYDARRGTALVQTLETYFAAGGSQARAATTLHVHVNTVTQRLDRIGQLLGPGWQQPDRALEIQLALRLHRLRTA